MKKYSLTGSFCEDLLKYLFFWTNIEDNFTIKFLVISTKFKFGNQLRIVDDIEREPFIVNVVVALVMDKIKFLPIFYLKKVWKMTARFFYRRSEALEWNWPFVTNLDVFDPIDNRKWLKVRLWTFLDFWFLLLLWFRFRLLFQSFYLFLWFSNFVLFRNSFNSWWPAGWFQIGFNFIRIFDLNDRVIWT